MGEEEKYKEELCIQENFDGREGHPCTDRAQEVVPPQVGRQVAAPVRLCSCAERCGQELERRT